MRLLYFDIDGTLLMLGTGDPKPALAGGRFQAEIRQAQVDRLVCVSNLCHAFHMAKEIDAGYDSLGMVFTLCKGVFADEEWFRSVTTLIADPEHRTAAIDFSSDWWYIDDMAEQFFDQAGLRNVFRDQIERRIFAPEPNGSGDDVLRWVARIAN